MTAIDEAALDRFYGDVPADHLKRYRGFLASHTLKRLEVGGVETPYYACGQGERTLVSFCGGHSTPATLWETISSWEEDHRIVVIDISGFASVAELCDGVGAILEHEGVERVVLLGASLAGLISQIFLKHHFERVEAVVLMNTMAMNPAGDKRFSLWLTRLMPAWLLRSIFGKKLRAYFNEALDDPQASAGARFGLAHLEEVLALHFTKRKVIHLLSVLFEFGREGYTLADLDQWQGRALVIVSEDDQGFGDLEWLTENLPRCASEVIPAGLGHLPQLAHRKRFETLIREFLSELD
jgi:pimeloyl-ACP methyl ester carboxylesterase